MLPCGPLRTVPMPFLPFSAMNPASVLMPEKSIAERHDPVGFVDHARELSQSRDADIRRQHLIGDAAPLGRGHAHHHVDSGRAQFRPASGNMAVVLRRVHWIGGVVHAIVVEKDAADGVALGEGGLDEVVGAVGGFVIVGAFLNQNRNYHYFSSPKYLGAPVVPFRKPALLINSPILPNRGKISSPGGPYRYRVG